jgi:hypothetical protein
VPAVTEAAAGILKTFLRPVLLKRIFKPPRPFSPALKADL